MERMTSRSRTPGRRGRNLFPQSGSSSSAVWTSGCLRGVRPDSVTATVSSAGVPSSGSIGTGLTRPPSASSRPLIMTGVMALGMAMDARIARRSGPRWNRDSLREVMPVATAVNGMH